MNLRHVRTLQHTVAPCMFSVTRKTNDKSISHTTGNNAFRNDKKNESKISKDDISKDDMKNLLYWFKINSPKANPVKFQFMILGKKNRLKYSLKMGSILSKSLTKSSY